MNYLIPKDTANLFNKNGLKSKDISNFALRLNKFVKQDLFEKKNEYENVDLNINMEQEQIDKYYDSLEVIPYKKDSIFVKNDWRLILGMGRESVYNTSITLHHIYGVPYLPAQSIKGAFRSYIIQKHFSDELFSDKYNDSYNKFEEEILFKCDWFINIFGSDEQQGKVVFFDAFNKSKDFKIVKDIMTPHYKDYYGEKKDKKGNFIPPTDTQDPVPITFLVVEKASFKICFASKKNYEIEEGVFKGKKVLEMIKEDLMTSLETFGIGGKTAVGYGYFDKAIEPKSPIEREWDIAKNTENPKILEAFIKKNPDSKYSELAEKKLSTLLQNIEDEKKEKKKNKLQEIESKAKKMFEEIQKKKGSKGFDKAKNNFIKKWSKKQENRSSKVILDLVEKF
jgi:CRISPR-associated protein Cmr6